MDNLPSQLYRTEQIRQLEQLAIDEFSIPAAQLMERAGHAAFEVIRQRWPWCRRIAVVCGSGNNGGDGYVLARLARQAGLSVKVAAVGEPHKIPVEAAAAWQRAQAAGRSDSLIGFCRTPVTCRLTSAISWNGSAARAIRS